MTQTSVNDLKKKDCSTDYWGEQLQRDFQESLTELPSLSNKINENIEIKNQLRTLD